MNAMVSAALDGELLSPAATVPVYGTTHPLNAVAGSRIHCRVPAGSSITEILVDALSHKPGWHLRRDLIVKINDHVIPEENWSRVRVKKGATVTFIPRLQGGGDVWRSVLGLAVTVAALIAAPFLAPGLITAFGAVGITVGASTAAALAAGGIILAGTLALNALFPVARPAPDSVNSRSLNSIQGAQNQANPFGPVPVVLGRHRQSSYYAAKPYTEIVGEDQYLRLLFCMGYGPLALADFRIGETPLTSFSDYQIEVRQGFPGDAPVTLYPGSVDEKALAITLVNGGDPPGTAGDNGVWNSQTTAAETDEISLDYTAPQGMFKIGGNGNLESWSSVINVQYRPVGTVDWNIAPNVTIARSNDPTRVGLVFSVTRGQYEVRSRQAVRRRQ
jgi:predicted phage tail protein